LLNVTKAIVNFGIEYSQHFSEVDYHQFKSVEDFGLSDLTNDEKYTSYGAIGGGIKSRFLYMLYPAIFANRGQNAIWALYFLAGRSECEFADGSEFLIIDTNILNKAGNYLTNQNYFYPYDLFSYYAFEILKMLRQACLKEGFKLNEQYRYVYLDAFLDFVAEEMHSKDIAMLKGSEYSYEE
jgi:hypothetical protein